MRKTNGRRKISGRLIKKTQVWNPRLAKENQSDSSATHYLTSLVLVTLRGIINGVKRRMALGIMPIFTSTRACAKNPRLAFLMLVFPTPNTTLLFIMVIYILLSKSVENG